MRSRWRDWGEPRRSRQYRSESRRTGDRAKFEERRNYPEMVCGMGEKGLAAGRYAAGGQLHIYERNNEDQISKSIFKARCWSHKLIFSSALRWEGCLETAIRLL